MNQSVFNDAASISTATKLTVKLTAANVTKRVRELPENFEALRKQIRAQMCKGKPGDQFIQSGQYQIVYEDDTGDIINLSDDEDLLAAYEVAETSMGRQLKLKIQPRAGAQEIGQPQHDQKATQKQEDQAQKETNHSKSFKEEDDQINSLSASFMRAAISDVVNDQEAVQKQPQSLRAGKDADMMSSSDSESDSSDDEKCKKSKKKRVKKEKQIKKKEKKDKEVGGLPRKQFKRLIKKEMSKQCKGLFEMMMNCKDVGQKDTTDDEQINSAGPVIHDKVECDGCGVAPIQGVRYKCSVCKNFDFCATCEERRGHEHAFLKIMKPDQAPKAIFTVIDENMKNAEADIEQDAQSNPTFFRNMPNNNSMPPWMRGGGCHRGRQNRGGRGGGNWGHCGGQWGQNANQGFPGQGYRADGQDAEASGQNEGHEQQQMFQNMMKGIFKGFRGGGGCHGAWGIKKAQVVSVPQEVQSGAPGEIFFVNVQIRNDLQWTWKQGASLVSNYAPATALLLDEVAIPIDFPVAGGETFKLSIPVKIKESAIATVFSAEKEHTAEFTFVGHQGRPFGQPIVVKFKVVKKIDELELYQKAMELFETQESETNTFEEIVDALKQTNNDPDEAKKLLAKKKCGMTVQAAEEEDLYS